MQQFFNELKRLFFNPFEAVTGLLETYGAWAGSRNWGKILPGLPLVLLMIGVLIYVALNESVGDQQRAKSFVDYADSKKSVSSMEAALYKDVLRLTTIAGQSAQSTNDAQTGETATSSPAAEEDAAEEDAVEALDPETQRTLRLALRRALQIDPEMDDAQYRLALVDAIDGNLDEANQRIANLVTKAGIPNLPAYHWQAIVLLNKRAAGENVLQSELAPVLEKAANWRNAQLEIRMANADMLMNLGKVDSALDQALLAAADDPTKYLIVANKAKANNRERILREATSKAEKYYDARLRANTESAADRIGFSQVLILQDRKDTAIEILKAGIDNSANEQPELRTALATIYLNDFVASESKRSADPQMTDETIDLSALEQAAEVDPMNPQLGRMIALLLASQVKLDLTLSKRLTDVLAKQVSENVIAPDTLMILGGLYYQKKKYAQAEQFWEKVVELQPTAVIALNNLALLQIEKPKPDPTKGLELIERAYQLAPGSVEINDSYGQILISADRSKEAIGFLERALRVDPAREGTRQFLAKAYEAIGQTEISESYAKFVGVNLASEANLEEEATNDEKNSSESVEPK